MSKKNNEDFEKAEMLCLFGYLVFSKNIKEDLNLLFQRVFNLKFLGFLNEELFLMQKNNIYPNKVYNNINIILIGLKKTLEANLDMIDYEKYNRITHEIMGRYNELKNKDDYELYLMESNMKFDNIFDRANNNYCLWKVEDIENSIRFDYSVMINLDTSDENYYNNVISYCLNNKNFIFFVKKMLILFPQIFLDDKIKHRILVILRANQEMINQKKTEAFDHFMIVNYRELEEYDKEQYLPLYDKFIFETNNLFEKIIKLNKDNYENNFEIESFIDYYKTTYLEQEFLKKNNKLNFDDRTLLEHIYILIEDNSKHKCYNLDIKRNIVEIMNKYREIYFKKPGFLDEYNKHMGILNSTEMKGLIVDDIMDKKLSSKEILYFIRSGQSDKELIKTLEFDYEVIKSFICSDEEYEDYKEKFISNNEYPGTINKMLVENEDMFDNKIIYNRVMNILNNIKENHKSSDVFSKESYKKSTKILKKLNKKYGKDE